jgi:integrase
MAIRAMQPPAKGNVVLWDDVVTGFGVRCSQGGTKSYFLMYGRERARHQIGRVGIISLQDARAAAKKFLAERTLGKRDAPAFKFPEAVTLFLESQDHLRPTTMSDYKRILKSRFEKPLRHLTLTEVQTHHIATILDKLKDKPGERKYAHSVIRRFFTWARSRRYLGHSPVEGLEAPRAPKNRSRVLSDDELRKVWQALGDDTYSVIVKLLILTGQRLREVAYIEQNWIDAGYLTIPAEHTKNGREHRIKVPDLALPLLARVRPFKGWSKAKARLDRLSGVTGYRIHDLRRTYSTTMQRLGVRLEVTEKLLNHVSGTQAGIVGVYQKYDWQSECDDAVTRYETFLKTLLAA